MNKEHGKEIYLLLEFMLFFLGVPLFLFLESDLVHPSVVLFPFMLIVFTMLHFLHGFKWHELWYFRVRRSDFLRQIAIVGIVSLLMISWVYFFDRKNLFNLPRENWKAWLMIVLFYPVFSAYTQEVIFRTFIFKRYSRLFKNESFTIITSACVFSFVHLFYSHPVSMILTFILGIYLGWIYLKTKSVLFAAILHGLMGIAVFSIGLGQYFWLDINKWM